MLLYIWETGKDMPNEFGVGHADTSQVLSGHENVEKLGELHLGMFFNNQLVSDGYASIGYCHYFEAPLPHL